MSGYSETGVFALLTQERPGWRGQPLQTSPEYFRTNEDKGWPPEKSVWEVWV